MFTPTKRPDQTDIPAPSMRGSAGSTIIARGVRVEGDFSSQGDVIIEGEVSGHVTTTAVLTVGAEAKLKAEVSADEASIAGQIDGTITVKKRLEVKATAKITGDITCETIVVEAGAALNGKVSVGPASPVPAKPTVKIASVTE